MPRELLDLVVEEVSLVDNPANPGATLLIYKRAGSGASAFNKADNMDNAGAPEPGMATCKKCGATVSKEMSECPKCGAPMMDSPAGEPPKEKQMDELKAKLAKVEADLKAAEELAAEEQKKRETAEAKVKALELDLTKAKLTPEAAEKKIQKLEEDLKLARMSPDERKKAERASLPETVRKQLEESEATIQKLQDERDAQEFEKRAADLKLAGISAAKLGPVLRRIAKSQSNSEDLTDIERLFKALSAQAKTGRLFEEFGKGGFESGAPSATHKVMERAKELQKADAKLNVADAITQVLKADAELNDAYLAESRGQA